MPYGALVYIGKQTVQPNIVAALTSIAIPVRIHAARASIGALSGSETIAPRPVFIAYLLMGEGSGTMREKLSNSKWV